MRDKILGKLQLTLKQVKQLPLKVSLRNEVLFHHLLKIVKNYPTSVGPAEESKEA